MDNQEALKIENEPSSVTQLSRMRKELDAASYSIRGQLRTLEELENRVAKLERVRVLAEKMAETWPTAWPALMSGARELVLVLDELAGRTRDIITGKVQETIIKEPRDGQKG